MLATITIVKTEDALSTTMESPTDATATKTLTETSATIVRKFKKQDFLFLITRKKRTLMTRLTVVLSFKIITENLQVFTFLFLYRDSKGSLHGAPRTSSADFELEWTIFLFWYQSNRLEMYI